MTTAERRKAPERRKAARGGRRPSDPDGYAPLVLVVGSGHGTARDAGVILGLLRFAVAPAATIEEATRVLETMHPDLVVASQDDARRLRAAATVSVPVVDSGSENPEALIGRIREALARIPNRPES
jgi:hypothetical protein